MTGRMLARPLAPLRGSVPRTAWPTIAAVATYGMVLVAAEGVAAFVAPVPAAAVHGVVLVALLSHYVLRGDGNGRVYGSLALVPLLRLSSLALPVSDPVAFIVVSGVPVLLGVALAADALGVPGVLRLWEVRYRAQWQVAVAAVALSAVVAPVLDVAPLAPGRSASGVIVAALVAFLFVGVLEELVFRGVIQGTLDPLLGPLSIPAANLLFAATYAGSGSAAYLLFMAAFGLACGWWVRRTGSVAGAAAAHGLLAAGVLVLWPALL